MRLVTRSDFDGLICAALLKEAGIVDSYKFVHPKDIQDGKVAISKEDVLANVPYWPGCGLWFDHHSSENFVKTLMAEQYEGESRKADSCARIIYEYYGGEQKFPRFAKMIEEVDKSDSGRLTKEDIENTYFVIDPIDGTHNFDMKWDFFGIMVSYVLEKETVFSIIHLPMLNIVCTAMKGKGTYLNGKRVYTKKMTDKLVGGCPVTKNNLESITKILNSNENVELRSLFCMAAEQTYVTSGIFDFAYSVNTGSIWDFVAAELMIKEAGGIMKLKKLENEKYNAIYGSKEAVEKIENIIHIL